MLNFPTVLFVIDYLIMLMNSETPLNVLYVRSILLTPLYTCIQSAGAGVSFIRRSHVDSTLYDHLLSLILISNQI
jgi:hypothetical protein